jgi:hypothetical protein
MNDEFRRICMEVDVARLRYYKEICSKELRENENPHSGD